MPKITTFRGDLAKAGIAHVDAAGRTADFHGLRLTFNMALAQAGVDLSTRMELMRHKSESLTLQTYADMHILNPAGAMASLPSLCEKKPAENPQDQRQALLPTGTDGGESIALKYVSDCPAQSNLGNLRQYSHQKTPINTGVSIGAVGFEPTTSWSQTRRSKPS